MNNLIRVFGTLLLLFGLIACATDSTIKITNDYLEYTSVKYRRTGAVDTNILWVGRKIDSEQNAEDKFEPLFFPVLSKDIPIKKKAEVSMEVTKS